MTWPEWMGYLRQHFGREDLVRNASILKALLKKWRPDEVEVMVTGAQLLGWKSLLALNAAEGVGRRMAQARYWDSQKRAPGRTLESLGDIFRAKGLV